MSTPPRFEINDLVALGVAFAPFSAGESVCVRQIGRGLSNKLLYRVEDPKDDARTAWVYGRQLEPPLLALLNNNGE